MEKSKVKLNYINKITSQNIDINQLRPNKSYDFLIENRNGYFEGLIKKNNFKNYLKNRNCPLCDKNNYKKIIHKDNLDIVQCNECNVVYVNPIFNEEEYLKSYDSEEYANIVKNLGYESHNYRAERFGRERFKFINKFHDLSLSKTYLDVGCSTGFTVEVFQENNWDALGIELNQEAVDFAQKRKINVKNTDLFDLNQSFSHISFFDVLEHLSSPKEAILKAKSILNKNGMIYIYVPNFNCATKELIGPENSHFIWPTHHLTYFTPETLSIFLEDCGFKIEYWETQGLDLLDIKWFLEKKSKDEIINSNFFEKNLEKIQFFINSSGYGKNLRMFARKK